jgi:hypothetical protein
MGQWYLITQQLWNVSITVSALLSGMDTISNHPIAGSIAVKYLSFLVPLGVLTDQEPTKSIQTISQDDVSAILGHIIVEHIVASVSFKPGCHRYLWYQAIISLRTTVGI